MSDFDSSLPVRTVSVEELQVQTKIGTKLSVTTATPGDVAVKLVDTAGTNEASIDATGALKVDGSGVTQPVSATSLPLPTGASTSANQTTEITSLQLIDDLPLAQGSTTSGEKGILDMGAVTTAAPTYTTGQTSPLSLTTTGALRTDSSATTQPVSGTVTANAGTGTFSENLVEVAGTAVDVNIGNASAGTLRVVLASDQPALLVDISGSTDKTNAFSYNTVAAVASNASSTHTYTPASTVYMTQVSAAASGKMKVEIQYGATGSETTRMVKFTTPGGGLSAVWTLPEPLQVTSAQSVKIIRTNMDNQAQDVYSTVEAWS